MKLKQIRIEKLFGKFDYTIDLNTDEGITILTGPNGYGKTTILNIIYGLFNDKRRYSNLYSSVICHFTDGKELHFSKKQRDNFSKDILIYLIKEQRLEQTDALKHEIERLATTFMENHENVMPLLNSGGLWSLIEKSENTIRKCSRELVKIIDELHDKEQKESNNLNASYAERLLEYKNPLSESEFENRFQNLIQKYQQLLNHEIYSIPLKKAPYDAENQRALSIYLEDFEQKTSVYDKLLEKLNVFTKLVNGKELVNKTMKIMYRQGGSFFFITSDNKILDQYSLSSGEQNETILLYELIFKAKPNSLVLIDEPETSLHVSWQHDFLRDLREIQKVNPLNFLIATHSPSIINENWHLVQDLYDKSKSAEDKENDQP